MCEFKAYPEGARFMTVHLIKLCVGVESLDDLRARHKARLRARKAAGEVLEIVHTTRIGPKRRDELLEGGALYWVIKGYIQARQPLKDLRQRQCSDGIKRCDIVLEPRIIPVMPTRKRAFQGWRYLDPGSAPGDLGDRSVQLLDIPAEMRAELCELGLI